MRLTQWMRDRIVSAAVKATFEARELQRAKDERVLARRVRDEQMSTKDLAHLNALPTKFFEQGGYVHAKPDEEDAKQYMQLSFESGLPVPSHIRSCTVIVSDLLWADIKTWTETNKELAAEKKAFEQQTTGVVAAFSTAEKLLAQWPTLAQLMPEGFFVEKAKPGLPVTTINALDAKLQSVRPFETEKVAA